MGSTLLPAFTNYSSLIGYKHIGIACAAILVVAAEYQIPLSGWNGNASKPLSRIDLVNPVTIFIDGVQIERKPFILVIDAKWCVLLEKNAGAQLASP